MSVVCSIAAFVGNSSIRDVISLRRLAEERERDRITPMLNQLLWLPVNWCREDTVLTLPQHAPVSPFSVACTLQTSRTRRPSIEKILKILNRNLNSFGQRSFSFIAPSVWNSLPASVRNLLILSEFSTRKTFLFRRVKVDST